MLYHYFLDDVNAIDLLILLAVVLTFLILIISIQCSLKKREHIRSCFRKIAGVLLDYFEDNKVTAAKNESKIAIVRMDLVNESTGCISNDLIKSLKLDYDFEYLGSFLGILLINDFPESFIKGIVGSLLKLKKSQIKLVFTGMNRTNQTSLNLIKKMIN